MTKNNLAPRFCANTTIGPIKLTDYIGKWLVIFSYDRDFTPVCTTEIISLSKLESNFNDINADILCMSCDSIPTHIAWVNDISKNTGIIIPFPIISDEDRQISNLYNMQENNCVYIIDPKQNIRSILTYPQNIGRNVSEIFRIVSALKATDDTNSFTPANWEPGNEVLECTPNGYIELMDRLRTPLQNDFPLFYSEPRSWQ